MLSQQTCRRANLHARTHADVSHARTKYSLLSSYLRQQAHARVIMRLHTSSRIGIVLQLAFTHSSIAHTQKIYTSKSV